MIKISNLSKSYGSLKIFEDFSCELPAGIHVIVGKNGVGKSTLIAMIAGILACDSGRIMFSGTDGAAQVFDIRHHGSYVPDKPDFYPFIRGKEFLSFIDRARQSVSKEEWKQHLLDFGLTEHLNKPFSEMSFGTKKKFFLTAALVGKPSVLVMDEPTLGLDDKSLAVLADKLRMVAATTVVIFSNHAADFLDDFPHSIISLSDSGAPSIYTSRHETA